MIGLMQKMFGDDFWQNAIIEATHWNYQNNSIKIRHSSNPPIHEDWWTSQFNTLFAREYGLRIKLPSVFIDTFYDSTNEFETMKFKEQTDKLLDFAKNRNPFECKDIKIALTEIRELQDRISNMEQDKSNKIKTIQDLLEKNLRLNQSLQGLQYSGSTASVPGGPASLSNQYCLSHECYTPTEFALFGVGICIAGMLLSDCLFSRKNNQFLLLQEFYLVS